MSINFSQSGKEVALKNIIGRTFSTNNYARLYTNNITDPNSAVIDDINECDVDGYTPVKLLQNNWTIVDSTASYPKVKYTLNEEVTIYGYFVTQNDILLYIEPLSTPINLGSAGGIVYVGINIGFL